MVMLLAAYTSLLSYGCNYLATSTSLSKGSGRYGEVLLLIAVLFVELFRGMVVIIEKPEAAIFCCGCYSSVIIVFYTFEVSFLSSKS